MRRPPSRSTLGLAAAVLALVGLTAASCGDNNGDIAVGAAGHGDVVEMVDAPGTVTAKSVATLSSPADGTVVALAVKPGDEVTAGQVLAVVDSPSAQARLANAADALDALKGGGSVGRTSLVSTQARTDEAAGRAFAAARDAANRIADATLRAALLAQVDVAERAYREAAASARALVSSVQRGLASVGQAMSALTAAQRAQAKAAYDLAKSTVDALTLRAPMAGVVQLGGTSSGSSSVAQRPAGGGDRCGWQPADRRAGGGAGSRGRSRHRRRRPGQRRHRAAHRRGHLRARAPRRGRRDRRAAGRSRASPRPSSSTPRPARTTTPR